MIQMEKIGILRLRLYILGLYICFAVIFLQQYCDATNTIHHYRARNNLRGNSDSKNPNRIHTLRKFDIQMPQIDSPNSDPYVGSPFSMSPYDSLPPYPSSETTPPYCILPPPLSPQPPSAIPSPLGPPAYTAPTFPGLSPPSNTPLLNPPTAFPSPPSFTPNPPSGPPYYEPSPPSFTPNPPYFTPSPSRSIPRFLPPIIYPPPTVPPPPYRAPFTALWCVAKASVPDPIIQEAMDYACFSGADCEQIQPSGSCFQPNTLFAHASYAFNSYWQRTKVAGGTCDFGGTAVLVTVDPSYDGCHFLYF